MQLSLVLVGTNADWYTVSAPSMASAEVLDGAIEKLDRVAGRIAFVKLSFGIRSSLERRAAAWDFYRKAGRRYGPARRYLNQNPPSTQSAT